MSEQWRIELLGGLRARRGAEIVTHFRSHQTGALLAFLAFHRHKTHARETLLELLWPDSDEKAGRNRLSVALSSLRSQLESEAVQAGAIIVADRNAVGLNAQNITTDVAEFEAALRTATAPERAPQDQIRLLSEAIALYRGKLLPGYYEEWIAPEERRLEELFFRALRRLIAHLKKAGEWSRALRYAERGVSLDPAREEAQRDLIVLYAARGQHETALRQGRELERLLKEQLGSEPTAATRALLREIEQRAQTVAPARAALPDAAMPDAPLQSIGEVPCGTAPGLPVPLTRFFGREAEVAQVQQMLLDSKIRLLTLTGAGGGGKTRLAIEAARSVAASFPGALWFVPLADLSEAHLIAGAMRESLALPPSPGTPPLEQVVQSLGAHPGRPALLILDNFEQLAAEGAATVQTLLQRVPHLRCLVTSRQKLNVEGEHEFVLPTLPTPEGSEAPDVMARYAGAALFIHRAQAAHAGFVLTQDNAPTVATLCRRLDGIPLALELAAARSALLTPAQIVAHLDERLDLLSSPLRDTHPRHRTLRAAIDWSFRLLPPDLQRFWARLSVFRGGWTFEAARDICAEKGALDALARLREGSLIVTEENRAPASCEMRFRMLETLREYAAEQLPSSEREHTRRQHAEYFARLAEDSEPALQGPEQAMWLARLDAEVDNLRAALAWTLENEPALALRMNVKLGNYWEWRGHFAEALRWTEAVLRLNPLPDNALSNFSNDAGPDESRNFVELLPNGRPVTPAFWRGRACSDAGKIAWLQGDYPAARALLEESISIFSAMNDDIALAWALDYLGLVFSRSGEVAQARALHERALAIGREHSYRELVVEALAGLVNVAVATGDKELLRAVAPEKLVLQRELDNQRGVGFALLDLSMLALNDGDLGRARSLGEESLGIFRALSESRGMAMVLGTLSIVLRLAGEIAPARAACREALELLLKAGNTWEMAMLIDQFAFLSMAEQQPEQAALLMGARESARAVLGSPQPPMLEIEHEHHLRALRAMLEPATFERAWAQGRALTFDEAVQLALQDTL